VPDLRRLRGRVTTMTTAERRREARASRAIVEQALDVCGWPWALRLSRWIDMLVTIEECGV
jgi:hypothetical protein